MPTLENPGLAARFYGDYLKHVTQRDLSLEGQNSEISSLLILSAARQTLCHSVCDFIQNPNSEFWCRLDERKTGFHGEVRALPASLVSARRRYRRKHPVQTRPSPLRLFINNSCHQNCIINFAQVKFSQPYCRGEARICIAQLSLQSGPDFV